MFRNRRTTQKPPDEFYHDFRQNFPGLGPSAPAAAGHRSSSLGDTSTDAPATTTRAGLTDVESEFLKDHDATPKASSDNWRLTPSLLDPNSYAFTSFANQPPGYYTPTPGGSNALYHHVAGDLHTPGMGMGAGLVTPLSLPTSEAGVPAETTLDMRPFSTDAMQTHDFGSFNPFGHPQSFAPSHFQHQPSQYDAMDASGNASPMDDGAHLDSAVPGLDLQSTRLDSSVVPTYPSNPFRFQVALNAPTAMIKHAEEIPITYLNKGQAYSISVVDTAPSAQHTTPVRYRTFVRVSFEDEQQRQRPGACWQLWKEGRGTNEAHQRGGRLQAVECVDPSLTGEHETKTSAVELESASFDGFSVFWTATPGSAAECSVAVRFNFLSTDFSHSKGVKGIPVRLCAKTEVVSEGDAVAAELCFCKVKLFRDHGAERKFSNDVAHVKKTIDKLKQQIAQAETGMKDFRKKKRSSMSAAKTVSGGRAGKAQKHKRTWSMDSASSSGERSPAEDDLHAKLATMQDMFTSTRPTSVLYLRGAAEDDPDLHPVVLTGEPLDLTKMDFSDDLSGRRRSSGTRTGTGTDGSSLVSPASSSSGIGSMQPAGVLHPAPQKSHEWGALTSVTHADLQSNPQHLASPPDHTVKILKQSAGPDGTRPQWIDATGVDAAYRPPPANAVAPVACLYVLLKEAGQHSGGRYRAVYLMQRTAEDLIRGVAGKCHIGPGTVVRAVQVNSKGLHIMVDDDVVRHLPEGQDMIVELAELHGESGALKRDWATSSSTESHADNDHDMYSTPVELRLVF
ncbi:MAG: hypothetical protein M1838_005167 [Thelocarpon superellum]|nr:MAG: hypothetical protein M1838_005167 [Thelocarpon superellum]